MSSLPGWLEPLPDAAEQRALDGWAINELGIPGLELMERAGRGLTELVVERVPGGRIVVVCGKGNNGGDGFVTARMLREQGREVTVMLLGSPDELKATRGRTASASRARRRSRSRRTSSRVPTGSLTRSSALGSKARRASRRPRRSRRSRTLERTARSLLRATFRAASTPPPARSRALPSRPTRRRPSTPPSRDSGSRPARITRATCAWSTLGSRPVDRATRWSA